VTSDELQVTSKNPSLAECHCFLNGVASIS